MTLQTTALPIALILLSAGAALQVPAAVASEPANLLPATIIQDGDEAGSAALADIEAEPLSLAEMDEVQGKATATRVWSGYWNWNWTGSQWTASWTWLWHQQPTGWIIN